MPAAKVQAVTNGEITLTLPPHALALIEIAK
jgi:hypothetical protein